MKPQFLFLFLMMLIIAVVIGWFYNRQILPVAQNQLQIPDNIDYYLSGVKMKSFNEQGNTSYQLNSPFLEHYVREDISVIQQPDIHYFADNGDWSMSAREGKLIHKTDIYEFQQQVEIQRTHTSQAMQLTSEQMIFNPDKKTLKLPVALQMKTDRLDLHAASAMLDMKNEQHVFQRVNAIYETVKAHEPS
jgi:LPS export ABC transporter protein LptC